MDKSLAEKASALAAKTYSIAKPQVVDYAQAPHPESGSPTHWFRVVSAEEGNGPAYTVTVDERGRALDVPATFSSPFAAPAAGIPGVPGPTPIPVAPVTINPATNTLTLNAGEVLDETITVTIPKNAGPAKADVYFLADTTGSMTGIIGAVQAGANNVLAALTGLGVDIAFGVGNYKDFLSGDPYAFQHQLSSTNVAANVTAAINTWAALGGDDTPEGDLFALDSLAVPPGGTIGWRAGSKRIIVWFGDAPGHDPICPAAWGGPVAITEASVTAKLVAEGIAVLAISTANPGLDDDPKAGAFGYNGACGAPGGLPGQATRISTSTGGAIATGINPGNIVNTIISLVTAAIAAIQNVKLVPSATIAPFVTSITPAGGYGPLPGDVEHTLKFVVRFTGIPCKSEAQVVTGTIDVVADGTVIARKPTQITVPPCGFVYAVKFVCGVQPECPCVCTSVQPGAYATEINIHNYSSKEVVIRKRFIPVVLAGAAAGREPRVATVRAEDKIVLPPHSATMDDCCRIMELLLGAPAPSPAGLTIGFVEFTTTADVAITAVYTASGKSGGVSIDVEQIVGKRL